MFEYPKGFFETLFGLAFIGFVAVVLGGIWLMWMVIQHLRWAS